MPPTRPLSAIVRSIQVGMPKNYGLENAPDVHDRPWTTGFYKEPVQGVAFVGKINIAGDAQADLFNHGGPDKAVLAYSADHYPKWRRELRIPEMPFGAFGENLTITGLSEDSVCIGDIYQVGTATFEVSQPRQPCWKLARRWRMHELTTMVVRNGRSGWYLRVLKEGSIETTMPVSLMDRPNEDWPVARANDIMNHRQHDFSEALALASVPKLAATWADYLRERAELLRATR